MIKEVAIKEESLFPTALEIQYPWGIQSFGFILFMESFTIFLSKKSTIKVISWY